MTTEIQAHNLSAEQAVLGILIEAPNRAESAGITPGDLSPTFGHDSVLGAILTVWEAKRTADPVLLLQELAARDQLNRLGSSDDRGASYLHTLIEAGRNAQNLPHYVQLVRAATVRRRLYEVGTRLTQVATSTADIDDMLDSAGELTIAMQMLSDNPISGDAPIPGLSLVQEFLSEPTPPHSWVIPGLLEHSDRVMVVAGEGMGKALAVDTPVLTVDGWKAMGALVEGDHVFHPSGKLVAVAATTDVMTDRPCYRVRLSDGSEIVADAMHLWQTSDYKQRQPNHKGPATSVLTTADLAGSLMARGGHTVNHSIDVCAPVQFPSAGTLPIPPYTLGAWLGDGSSLHAVIACADPEIIDEIRLDGYTVRKLPRQPYAWSITNDADRESRLIAAGVLIDNGATVRQAERQVRLPRGAVTAPPQVGSRRNTRPAPLAGNLPTYDRDWSSLSAALRKLGVHGDKHIPQSYLTAPAGDRLALLQGLMDTDGSVEAGNARCEITLTNQRLVTDVHELIVGLGHKATIRESAAKLDGREVSRRWRISFQTELPVFRMPRKLDRLASLRTRRSQRRYVVAVDPIPSEPVRCIQVDSPDGMFLAGRSLVATHNSVLSRQVGTMVAGGRHPFSPKTRITPKRVLTIDLENPPALVRRNLRTIVGVADHGGLELGDRMWRWNRPGGLDLRSAQGRALFAQALDQCRPDLVCVGPLYKMSLGKSGDSYETAAAETAAAIDQARDRFGCAFWIEHHMAKPDQTGQRNNPIGSSYWMRWPEFGLVLRQDKNDEPNVFQLGRFRGDRDDRVWPQRLLRLGGGTWPWTADYDDPLEVDRMLHEASA